MGKADPFRPQKYMILRKQINQYWDDRLILAVTRNFGHRALVYFQCNERNGGKSCCKNQKNCLRFPHAMSVLYEKATTTQWTNDAGAIIRRILGKFEATDERKDFSVRAFVMVICSSDACAQHQGTDTHSQFAYQGNDNQESWP